MLANISDLWRNHYENNSIVNIFHTMCNHEDELQTGWLYHTNKNSHKLNIKYIYIVIKIKYTTWDVRALAFHQCVRCSIPGPGVIPGLSLLVLNSVPIGFSLVSPVFPSYQKSTFEFVPLWLNLICAWTQKLFSFKRYPVKIKVIMYYFKNVYEILSISPMPA